MKVTEIAQARRERARQDALRAQMELEIEGRKQSRSKGHGDGL